MNVPQMVFSSIVVLSSVHFYIFWDKSPPLAYSITILNFTTQVLPQGLGILVDEGLFVADDGGTVDGCQYSYLVKRVFPFLI